MDEKIQVDFYTADEFLESLKMIAVPRVGDVVKLAGIKCVVVSVVWELTAGMRGVTVKLSKIHSGDKPAGSE